MGFAASSFIHPVLFAAADAGHRAGGSGAVSWEEDHRDREIVARITCHDSAAFDTLVEFYSVKLARFAEGVTGSPDLGDEAAQDVLVAVWDQRTTLDIRGSVGGYLYRATRNRALNIVRRERSQHRVANDSAANRVVMAENDAIDTLDMDDVRADVRKALAHVPPRCREIFFLIWANELTYDEAADVLGVGVRTVQNQYYRAIGELARYYGYRRVR
jgi:RNA polymerase sigma-70 factor (ECF subfamily)